MSSKADVLVFNPICEAGDGDSNSLKAGTSQVKTVVPIVFPEVALSVKVKLISL